MSDIIEPSQQPEPAAPAEAQLSPVVRPKGRSALIEMLQTILLAVALYFAIDAVVARVRVENISMEPTLQPGEFILVSKLAYRLGEMHTGDVVVFHHSATEDYIKRLIGLPGQTVRVASGRVFVNDHELIEPYISEAPAYSGEWIVPEDFVFVLGDNRNQSSDSHSWGFVPVDTIVGKALVVYWPFDQLQVINSTTSKNTVTISP